MENLIIGKMIFFHERQIGGQMEFESETNCDIKSLPLQGEQDQLQANIMRHIRRLGKALWGFYYEVYIMKNILRFIHATIYKIHCISL